jgi:hypothetical protein
MTHLLRVAGGALLALTIIGCAPPPGSTPGAPGDAGVATKQLVIGALSAAGVPAADSTRPYRPSETPVLIGAARSVIQAQLANDPDHGFIVIYSFPSAVAAENAAFDQAAYVASPAGGIQFPPGSHFVIRILDTAVVFFTWSPGTSPDVEGQQRVEDALSALGIAVPISG